jgi:hypothetical protein
MNDATKENLNVLLVGFFTTDENIGLDAGFVQHMVDHMVDAIDSIYSALVAYHKFLMGS